MQRTQLLDGVPVPPPECADLIASGRTSPPTVPGGYVLPVTGPRGTAGCLLALESADSVPAGVSAVQHISAVAALQLSMLAHEREMMRRQGAETLAEMLQGVLDKALVAKRLAAQGFALDCGLMLAIVRPRHESADDDSAVDVLLSATWSPDCWRRSLG
jgi:PucR family transcriptional regulator, purine catabolism regulatory protein